MQIRRFLTGWTLALVAGVLTPPLLGAQLGVQRTRNVPGVYAITNARIVPVSSPAIERGTVVIRNGLIAAVGASVAVPADATVIDGNGLTVYPGVFDAQTSVGLQSASSGNGAGRGGRGAPAGPVIAQQASAVPNSIHPVGLQPELDALDLLHAEDAAFDGPHSAGIATALAAPSQGIFRGQAAVIDLSGLTAQDLLVKQNAAQVVGFTPSRGGGYPNSLLGVFSALRQMLLDAQHYALVQSAYAKNPRGMRRPENDPSLEALQPVLNRQVPVIMLASEEREIERALDLAKEFNLEVIIAGGEEADQIAGRLKAENVPVLLSLNFPRRPAASPDADPEPLRVLRARVEAPKLAGKLAKAGVRFAFEDGGLTSWPDFLGNVNRSVEAGLTPDQAVRALTLAPAEIFGVADRLGSIEPGKIANLTVTRGDLFSGRVARLFIDGAPVEVKAPASNGAAATATGTWTVTVTTDEGDRPMTISLQQAGTELRGTVQGSLGSSEISNGSVGANGDVKFTASLTMQSGTEEATFAGTVNGNVIRGTMTVVGHPPASFVGSRPDATGGRGRRGTPPSR